MSRGVGGVVRRLAAPEPTWVRAADVVVIGSGVAGLTVALAAHQAGRQVLVITKARTADGSTSRAQGGIAVALAPDDHPQRHLRDTLTAGAGLCDEMAVRAVIGQGPQAIRDLIQLGARFDTEIGGGLAFTREGGHSRNRVLHAGGDATGWEVQRVLRAATAGIEVVEQMFALDLMLGAAGEATGLTVAILDTSGAPTSVGMMRARVVVLATGGFGQLFPVTSNPEVVTGDGLALALRAGAEVVDLEFTQFHPTVFALGGRGRRLLISEAVRGEGAVLVDATGRRIMAGKHPLADLAPRDIIAREISRRMAQAPGGVRDHVFLDARALGATLEQRFPTIVAGCRAAGVDPVTQPIPVAPAAHYACGGVRTNLAGRTSIPGLYAVGEVACTGLHGANRLASNSLLEGLVMGRLLAEDLTGTLPAPWHGNVMPEPGALISTEVRAELTTMMSRHAGVLRTVEGMSAAADVLARLRHVADAPPSRAAWEVTNLHTVATALIAAAQIRQESRGCHTRDDWPEPRGAWQCRLVSWLAPDGTIAHHLDTEGAAA